MTPRYLPPLARLAGLVVLVIALAAPSSTQAHPLGNFTVNQYSRIEPAGDGVRIHYVLDLAEIPAFQEQARLDTDGDGRVTDVERDRYARARAEELRRNLHLTLDDAPVDVRLVDQSLSFPPGQGGLETLRLEALFAASIAGGGEPLLERDARTPGGGDRAIELLYRDGNDLGRPGWREIVARPGADGARIERSTVPGDDQSDELRRYPDDLLSSPLDVREARLAFVPGPASPSVGPSAGAAPEAARRAEPQAHAASAPASRTTPVPASDVRTLPASTLAETGARAAAAAERDPDTFAALVATGDLSVSVILLSLMTALVLGAVHALSPGHGKTVVAAYLVGSRGTARHALFLGATVTATHTIGVYALGLVTLYLSQYVLPERLYPVLEIISGLLVVGIGGWLLIGRLRGATTGHHHHHDHDHEHRHAQGHSDGHAYSPGPERARGQLDRPSFAHRARRVHTHHPDGAHPHDHRSDRTHGPEAPSAHGHGHAGLPHGHGSLTHGHASPAHAHRSLTHSHGGSTHSHLPPGADGQPVTWRSLLALGVSGGLLPCPSALVVMLSAIALHRVVFGLVLIVAFSIGLASVLVGIGLLLVFARERLQRLRVGGGLAVRYVPVVSAFVVLVAGLLITVQAVPRLL